MEKCDKRGERLKQQDWKIFLAKYSRIKDQRRVNELFCSRILLIQFLEQEKTFRRCVGEEFLANKKGEVNFYLFSFIIFICSSNRKTKYKMETRPSFPMAIAA